MNMTKCSLSEVMMWEFTIFKFMQNEGQNETQVKLIAVTY